MKLSLVYAIFLFSSTLIWALNNWGIHKVVLSAKGYSLSSRILFAYSLTGITGAIIISVFLKDAIIMDGWIVVFIGFVAALISCLIPMLVSEVTYGSFPKFAAIVFSGMAVILLVTFILAGIICPGWILGNRSCPKCQEVISQMDTYCSTCGYEITHKCTDCNEPLKEGDKYCSNCGATVEED